MQREPDESADRFGLPDAVLPKDMAKRAERAGAEKAEQDGLSLLALAALAGAYIAFGATFAASVSSGFGGDMPHGLGKMLGGIAFSLAYVLAIVGGAELFTTNNLMVMAWAHGRLPTWWLLRAWAIVFVGNFIGAVATGAMLIVAGQHQEGDGAVGSSLIDSAARLSGLDFVDALFLGILGNTLLCLGVWLTYSARSTTDRILALTPPVAAFYALGLEHAVAVMFYLPCAAFIAALAEPSFWNTIQAAPLQITPVEFLRVLLPVTLGNVIGGGVLVALMYWFVYLRPGRI
ncbi:formate/nitrite transporter family protein [Arhodomonas sp. AD133]|uniref:formate/nitrite transporter family protein n=1 Tax=Arhodomonas sp. AD133 TaxID=3415009 RepID=UPI003EBE946B